MIRNVFGWVILLVLVTTGPVLQAQTGTVTFSSNTYSVSDTATSVFITVAFQGGTTNDTPSVVLRTSNGTAVAGSDYSATTTTVSFAAGQVTASAAIPILTDGTLDAEVTVNLSLSDVTGAFLGNPSNAVLTITATGGGGGGTVTATGTHVLPVKLSGIVTQPDGTKVKVRTPDLVGSDKLVLVLAIDDNIIGLGQLDDAQNLTFLGQSTTAAILANGSFSANLAMEDLGLVDSTPTATPSAALDGTHVFWANISGFLTQADGVQATFGNNSLVGRDQLVLVLENTDVHGVGLGKLDRDGDVTMIGNSLTAAILSNGIFSANLTFDSVNISNNSVNIVGTGDLIIKGQIKTKTGKTHVSHLTFRGVFNDSVAGNSNTGNALLNSTILVSQEITDDVGFIDDPTENNGGAIDWQIKGSFTTASDGSVTLRKASILGAFDNNGIIKATVTPAGKEFDVDDINFEE